MRRSLFISMLCWLFMSALMVQASEPPIVTQIRVQPDQAPDCTSLATIVQSVTRDCTSNDAKAIALYNFMQLGFYHRNYPTEAGGLSALKVITNYGWSLCGGQHAVQSALWRELGWNWRFVGWSNPGHTTVEAEYDGRWHYLDVFLKFYAWMPDGSGGRTIAGQEDIAANPTLLSEGMVLDKGRNVVYAKDNQFIMAGEQANWRAPAFLSCGDGIAGILSGVASRNRAGSPEGWSAIHHANGDYHTDVDLAPGHALTNTWDPLPDAWYWQGSKTPPAHTCGGHKDTRNDPGIGLVLAPYVSAKPARSYANGMVTFAPDLASGHALQGFLTTDNVTVADRGLAPVDATKPAVVVFRLASPYNLTKATGSFAGTATVEVSTDGGKNWVAVDPSNFDQAVQGKLVALVRLTFTQPLTALRFDGIVQNNPGALPYLSPGRNAVTVSVADPAALGDNRLVVTYAYRLGSSTKSFEQFCEQGKEVAKGHNTTWSDTVTYVRKTFTAQDLPATFTIDCSTPKGQYPAYPRMLFQRREIVAPGATPSELPVGAVEAKPGAADELLTLPNPFLVGTETPPVITPRATRTIELPLSYLQFCDVKGTISESGALRWPKSPVEKDKVVAGVVLITGDLKDLPAKKAIAAARLMVPVVRGHASARAQLGVVFLPNAPVKGAGFDLNAMPDPQGSGQIPQQPADMLMYQPAKVFPVDITAAIKAIAAREATFNGMALRVVPNRSVDEGYTVRCEVSPSEPIMLQVDVYVDAP